jgi:tetratricopeptide (TPR) repeat protein
MRLIGSGQELPCIPIHEQARLRIGQVRPQFEAAPFDDGQPRETGAALPLAWAADGAGRGLPGRARLLSQCLALDPQGEQTRYLANNNTGYALNQLGSFEQSEPYCREVIQIDPERFNAFKNLGVSLEGQGCYAEAASPYAEAIRLEPEDPRAREHLQDLLRHHPEIKESMDELS